MAKSSKCGIGYPDSNPSISIIYYPIFILSTHLERPLKYLSEYINYNIDLKIIVPIIQIIRIFSCYYTWESKCFCSIFQLEVTEIVTFLMLLPGYCNVTLCHVIQSNATNASGNLQLYVNFFHLKSPIDWTICSEAMSSGDHLPLHVHTSVVSLCQR